MEVEGGNGSTQVNAHSLVLFVKGGSGLLCLGLGKGTGPGFHFMYLDLDLDIVNNTYGPFGFIISQGSKM